MKRLAEGVASKWQTRDLNLDPGDYKRRCFTPFLPSVALPVRAACVVFRNMAIIMEWNGHHTHHLGYSGTAVELESLILLVLRTFALLAEKVSFESQRR